MNSNCEDSDFCEYKLVRIKKKNITHYSRNCNYKEKEKKTFNQNIHIHQINKDQKKIEKYDFQYCNYKKNPNRNNYYNQFSYHNQRNIQYTNKYTTLEEVSLNQNKPIKNINNYQNDTRMAIQTISDTINAKPVLKNKLNKEKVHDWNHSKVPIKDKKIDSPEEPIFKNTDLNYSPYFFPNFQVFPNQFMFFMPPPVIFNPQQIHFEHKDKCTEFDIARNEKFLNHDKNSLQELSRVLNSECKSLQNFVMIEEKTAKCPQTDEIILEIQKSEELDSINDISSNSTNEENSSTINDEKSINVTIQLEKEKKEINILIDENFDILSFSKKLCKENNLKEQVVFSIYKKIKSSLDCYNDIKSKYRVSNYKNFGNYFLSDEYSQSINKID